MVSPGSVGAAGYIYMFEVNTDAHALFFGRCESTSELLYRVTSTNPSSSRHFRLRIRGDFSPLMGIGLNQIGQSQMSVRVQANQQSFSIDFEPDSSRRANTLFRTSNNLRGVAIETQSSAWPVVVAFGIFVVGFTSLVAISEDVNVNMEVVINTPAGSGNANIHVGGEGEGEGAPPPTP